MQDGAVLHADPGVPCTVGAGALVAAGALVREGVALPDGVLVAGVPARVVRPLTDEERARLARTAAAYLRLQARHRAGEFPAFRGAGWG